MVSEDRVSPSGEEVGAALDVLRRAGWDLLEKRRDGVLDGEGFLVPGWATNEDAREYRAWYVREPWTEVSGE